MIRIDDLQFQGLVLLQETDAACFSEDSVLLANFLRLSPADRAVDLGAGNGILSILGQAKTGASFVGVEPDAAQCSLARQSASRNGQEIPFLCITAAQAPAELGHGSFTAAVMNPPFFTTGDQSQHPSRAAARHADRALLTEFLSAAFLLLKNGGKLFICYPAHQLTDLLYSLRANRLEPKRLRPALPNALGAPNRVLVEAKKLGKPGLVYEPMEAGSV